MIIRSAKTFFARAAIAVAIFALPLGTADAESAAVPSPNAITNATVDPGGTYDEIGMYRDTAGSLAPGRQYLTLPQS